MNNLSIINYYVQCIECIEIKRFSTECIELQCIECIECIEVQCIEVECIECIEIYRYNVQSIQCTEYIKVQCRVYKVYSVEIIQKYKGIVYRLYRDIELQYLECIMYSVQCIELQCVKYLYIESFFRSVGWMRITFLCSFCSCDYLLMMTLAMFVSTNSLVCDAKTFRDSVILLAS